ncbi:MAG: hypothetical protein SAK29_18925 [Scytonema sp. PMC 1069.18]|nr:hypothetical protein [Scytonema sp. PMC 1069.18]MEC4885956.1 hypothetical protein [Scytonema sp. PMC 1070.18]
MRRVVAMLKNLRPLKTLTTLFAGFILFFTQACNGSIAAQAPRQTVGEQNARPNAEVYVPKGDRQLSPVEGGMNNFSDVDPRTQNANVRAKAEALKENAEQNINSQSSDLGDITRRILNRKDENIGDLGNNVQYGAQKTADEVQGNAADFVEGTKRGIRNIQENASDTASDLGKNAKRAAEDVTRNAQRTAEDAGDAVNRTFRQAIN